MEYLDIEDGLKHGYTEDKLAEINMDIKKFVQIVNNSYWDSFDLVSEINEPSLKTKMLIEEILSIPNLEMCVNAFSGVGKLQKIIAIIKASNLDFDIQEENVRGESR